MQRFKKTILLPTGHSSIPTMLYSIFTNALQADFGKLYCYRVKKLEKYSSNYIFFHYMVPDLTSEMLYKAE